MKTLQFVVETFDLKTKQANPELISVVFAGDGYAEDDKGFAILNLRHAISETLQGARVYTLHEYQAENSGPMRSGLVTDAELEVAPNV